MDPLLIIALLIVVPVVGLLAMVDLVYFVSRLDSVRWLRHWYRLLEEDRKHYDN